MIGSNEALHYALFRTEIITPDTMHAQCFVRVTHKIGLTVHIFH